MTSSTSADVVIVGAGLSGIGAAYFLQRNCRDKRYIILESRDAIGGTWDLFRYPGIRSDSSMYTFGYSFKPWIGKKYISDGPSILSYIHSTASQYSIMSNIKHGYSVQTASWDSNDSRWHLTALNKAGNIVHFDCSFLFMCTGYYDYQKGYTPEFPGYSRYKGILVHPQQWPSDLNYDNKEIVVVGSGATAVTLVPELAKRAKHVTMLQRSPTYIAALPSEDSFANRLYRMLPESIAFLVIRWRSIIRHYLSYWYTRKNPLKVKAMIIDGIKAYLGPEFDVDKHFTPKYNPWDQRFCLCPDGDFFAALKNKSASVVTDHISTFTETGISLQSGQELEADIIITATGLNLKILGGVKFTVDGMRLDTSQCYMYKGALFSGVPNLAWSMGYTNASYTLKCDLTCEYVTRILNLMDRNGYRSCTPTPLGPPMPQRPLLDLTSNYIIRSMEMYPKQGNRFPWRYNNNYFRDVLIMRYYPLRDKELVFA